jgi:hypothetical protein
MFTEKDPKNKGNGDSTANDSQTEVNLLAAKADRSFPSKIAARINKIALELDDAIENQNTELMLSVYRKAKQKIQEIQIWINSLARESDNEYKVYYQILNADLLPL